MIKSAGIVLFRPNNNDYEFLLMRCYNLWEPSKGRQDGEESLLQTAYRETEEETGITAENILLWTDESYTTEPYAKPLKTATYYLGMSFTDKVSIVPNAITGRVEHHEYKWVNYDQAKTMTNDRIGGVLDWAYNIIINNTKSSSKLFEQTKKLVDGIDIDLNKPLVDD